MTHVIFYAVLPNGKHNSVSTTNLVEAIQRARTLGARNLFVFDTGTRDSKKVF